MTGIRSGLLAARDELRFGFFDGMAGTIKQPYLDTKEYGPIGAATGVGKGVGGLVLKPLAGVFGMTAYVGKGVQAEARKRFRDVGKTERWVRRARIVQAGRDIQNVTEQEKKKRSGADAKGGKSVEQMRLRALDQWKAMEKEREEEVLESRKRSVWRRASVASIRQAHKA